MLTTVRHVQCGWVLTVANLGDSRALIDTGAAVTQVTVDHRVATHAEERGRLEADKILIAPIDSSGEQLSLDCLLYTATGRGTAAQALHLHQHVFRRPGAIYHTSTRSTAR